jgi:hypothetical protein
MMQNAAPNLRPPDFYDLSVRFAIDRVAIEHLKNRPQIRVECAPSSITEGYFHGEYYGQKADDQLRVVMCARRILEAAYGAYCGGLEQKSDPEAASNWEAVRDSAIAALNAYDSMAFALSQCGRDHPDHWKRAGQRLSLMLGIDGVTATRDVDRRLAKRLSSIRDDLKRFSNASTEVAGRVRSSRVNQGNLERSQFLRTMAEGWAFLVGRAPGRQQHEKLNPFLRFVYAGWSDLGGSHDVQMDSYLKKLPTLDGGAKPSWW